MNDHNHNEPRLDETPAVDIINASYCIGRMEAPIRRSTGPPFRSTGSIRIGQEYDDYQETRS